MLTAKLPTLMKTHFDCLSRPMTQRFLNFAQSEVFGVGGKNSRYSIKRIEGALDYCCDHLAALNNYKTITEARQTENPGKGTQIKYSPDSKMKVILDLDNRIVQKLMLEAQRDGHDNPAAIVRQSNKLFPAPRVTKKRP